MFEPENDFERSLVKAAADVSHRPQFYRDLLESELFIINQSDEPPESVDGQLKPGSNIQLQAWQREGREWLPIFSSLALLQQSVETEVTFLRMNAGDFFDMVRGANVVLNPNCDYGKEFDAEELAALLDGSIFNANQGYTVEKETEVLIGQPETYPQHLVGGLNKLFAKHESIDAAYLAQFHDPERDKEPHTLIGIETDGPWDTIVGEAGMVASETMPGGKIVDFIRITGEQGGLSEYLLDETDPFYEK